MRHDFSGRKPSALDDQTTRSAVQVSIDDSSSSTRFARSPGGENSRTKVQNVLVDSTGYRPVNDASERSAGQAGSRPRSQAKMVHHWLNESNRTQVLLCSFPATMSSPIVYTKLRSRFVFQQAAGPTADLG